MMWSKLQILFVVSLLAVASLWANERILQDAKIQEADPKLNFVVLNIGATQGVRVGMPFQIVRGEQVIAEASVVDVRENISGAMLKLTGKNLMPQRGDSARVATE